MPPVLFTRLVGQRLVGSRQRRLGTAATGYDLSLPCPLKQNRMTTVRRRSAEEHYVLSGLQVLFSEREESAGAVPVGDALVVVGFPTTITEPTLRVGSY